MTVPDLLDENTANGNYHYHSTGNPFGNDTRNGNSNGATTIVDDGDRTPSPSFLPPSQNPSFRKQTSEIVEYDRSNQSNSQAHAQTWTKQGQNQQHQQRPNASPESSSFDSTNQQPHHGQSPYVYATSYAGQPVLVSVSPVTNGNTDIPPGLPAAHYENPVAKGIRRNRRRRNRMIATGVGGAVAGAVVLGPFGLFIGYFAGSTVGLTTAVAGENRKDRRLRRERENFAGAAN